MSDTAESIRARFEQAATAWNRGDLDAYLTSYWDSEETLWISRGTIIRGITAIRSTCKSLYASPETMGKFEIQDLQINVLTESDALVIGTWLLTVQEPARNGVFTVLMKRLGGEWVVVMDHTSSSDQ
jgi:uncharacterized protein (TIGR02246 family)